MRKPFAPRALVTVLLRLVAATTGLLLLVGAPASAEHRGEAPRAQWMFGQLGVPDERPAGDGVVVAVIDSGVDRGHPAFAGRIAAAVDCVGSAGDPAACTEGGGDENGHGTHIAGIIAARPRDGGPEGVAPNAQLLAIRALTNSCAGEGPSDATECRATGDVDDVVAGVRWAAKRGAHIINLSIDAGVDLDWRTGALADAISDAWKQGSLIVASAGNRGKPITDTALSAVPLVLVGAVDAAGRPASYSNLPGTARWGLLAPGGEPGEGCPGEGIISTYPRALAAAGTGCLSGTSMAAAYVSGSLASLISSGLDGRTALAHLLQTARAADAKLAPVADLGNALRTPPTASGDELAAGVAHARRVLATADPAPAPGGRSALTAFLDAWTTMHPVRTRAFGIAAMSIGAWLLLAKRRAGGLLRL